MSNSTFFSTVSNQKVVHVHRDMPKKDESGFLLLKKENLHQAYKDLDYPGVYLYLYMVGNKDSYTFALSPKAVENITGMPDSTASKYIQRLIEKGYLVPHKEGSNHYDFYEVPYGKKDNKETNPSQGK